MVVIKSNKDIEKMREAGRLSANALALAGRSIEIGMTTGDIDRIIKKYFDSVGAVPSFLNYNGFPASSCISVNNEVIHGIPNNHRKIKDGDIVSIDVGAYYGGFHGDNAFTFAVGNISDKAKKLLEVTKASLDRAISVVKPGARLGDVSSAVESYVREFGLGVVKNYCGHGVGRHLHEDPEIPNYGMPGTGITLRAGMTLAIEPMINYKGDDIFVLPNRWTVVTKSGSLSAHFENTVVVTSKGCEILTVADADI
jgi:methionyl aminopeptidase